jgi:hypothetical protein
MNSAQRSFFKVLFFSTSLHAAARRMSHAKVAPEGLKSQEYERNMGRSRPPIPYIPKKDVIQVLSIANTLMLIIGWLLNYDWVYARHNI